MEADVVFNLLEEFDGIVTYDQHVVAFLELMHQPYTGCNPRGMLLSRDKVLSKQLLSYHRVPTPQFMVFPRGKKPRIPKNLRFPLFVKSSTEDASLGIAQASVVADPKQLAERIAFIHEQTHSDALVEEYIEGRELYVGVMGNDRLKVLPVWEMTFGSLPENLPAIATRKVKWDRGYQQRYGITTAAAAESARGHRRALGAIVEAHLSCAAFDRLRAHGLSLAGRRRTVRARGERQSEYLSRRGFLRLGTQSRHGVRRLAAPDYAVGRELPCGLARCRALRRGTLRRGALRRGTLRRAVFQEPVQRSSHASTVSCHWMLSAGFSTQWFSSGKYSSGSGCPCAGAR